EMQDGFLALAGVPEPAWAAFAALIGATDLIDDPRFVDQMGRREHSDELAEEVARRLRALPMSDVLQEALVLGVRCTAVQDYRALAADPQVAANAYVRHVDHPTLGPTRVTGNPIRYGTTPLDVPVAAPGLGADTDATLAEAGYAPEERARLRADGIVG
ncbi:MAG: CoA transferase, partial [Dehalococcoidia bacterium]